MSKFFIGVFFLATFFLSANEQKIYVSPQDIEITQNGIYYIDREGATEQKIDALQYDEHGLYFLDISQTRGPCGLHQVYHADCGGCGVLFCPMNCTCFD